MHLRALIALNTRQLPKTPGSLMPFFRCLGWVSDLRISLRKFPSCLIIQIIYNLVMTWTRLLYIKNVQKAMKRVIPGETLEELPISKRYQGELRKQFRMNGVPWIYDLKQRGENPRDRPPKPSKALAEKVERLKRIQKNLLENDKKLKQFRQEKLDARPLGGIDKLIAKTLPSHIKGDSEDIPDFMKKKSKKNDD